MALGNLILDETGQVMGMRVLSNDANGVNVEVSLQTTGTIRRVPENTLWTYNILTRPDGSVQGGGNGIMTTKDGDVISLIGNGSGKAVPPGETTNFRTMLHPQRVTKICRPKWNGVGGRVRRECRRECYQQMLGVEITLRLTST